MKKTCAGINSFSGGAAAGLGAGDLLTASPLGAVQRLGREFSKKLSSCDCPKPPAASCRTKELLGSAFCPGPKEPL